MRGTVAWLCLAPVKGMRLQEVDELILEEHGARNDRRFVVTDDKGHLVNGKHLGALMQLVATCDDRATTLTIRFPDGNELTDVVRLGDAATMIAYGHPRAVQPVLGPWSTALSRWAGRDLRMVQPVAPGDGVDRGRPGGVTLLSEASLRWLGDAGAVGGPIDKARFRMTIGVGGVDAFAEERWLGHRIRVGEAAVRLAGNVGRCAVTTRDPRTGVVSLDVLQLLARLRSGVVATEPLPFGVWGEVVVPGCVRLADEITTEDP
ncbi:MAG: MOSC domain-containing protein [Candidatus Dormibacteria bacterium]